MNQTWGKYEERKKTEGREKGSKEGEKERKKERLKEGSLL